MPGRLILPRGLPASGKTTRAREYVAARPAGEVIRLNRDDLRAMALPPGYAKPEHQAEEAVSLVQRGGIVALLRRGVDVIVDDTNLRFRHVRDLDKLAQQAGAETVLWDDFLAVTVGECVRRDALRAAQVGEAVIRGMHERYLSGGRKLPPLTRDEPVIGAPYLPPPRAPRAVIVDIDGTVALMNGRGPYDTSRYDEDVPNRPVIEQVRLCASAGYVVLFTSGRSEEFRDVTTRWLIQHVVTAKMMLAPYSWDLIMRPAGDTRNDAVVKLELFNKHIRHEYDVRFVYDDRDRVVAAFRSIGLTVAQVAPGSF